MRVLLVSTYDMGRQPFGLASPAAWLSEAGADVRCLDLTREKLQDDAFQAADVVGFFLPMHTATRLALPVIDRVRAINPRARVIAYGLYAPLNATLLRERGVTDVLGGEFEAELVERALSDDRSVGPQPRVAATVPRLQFKVPSREGLPPLTRYATLLLNGERRTVGYTEASRGCKHRCRHCPIVPVYRGAFRAIPVDVVLEDVRMQITAGAQHVSFGDPDFFNGPSHARRVVERLAAEHPGVGYDVTIKIEHLLKHADMLPLLRDTGCLFVTSAVESIDPVVLHALRKGHTREDFVRAVELCRAAGVRLSPTFVPFTPWTTAAGYVDLLDQLRALELEEDVAPIQLGIRLLVTADSALLELDEIRGGIASFDPESLTYPWRHADASVDTLQMQVMHLVSAMREAPRHEIFDAIDAAARAAAHASPRAASPRAHVPAAPHMTEAWYCCAEPGPDIASYV